MKVTQRIVVCISLLFLASFLYKEDHINERAAATKERVVTDKLQHPWEILWGPDKQIWMTERGGKISKVDPETGAIKVLIDIEEVQSNGEGGLLGMALHPDFASNPFVYVAYNYDRSGDYKEKIVRYSYNGSTLSSPKVLLDNIAASGIHNGCRLLITPDKKLLITTGDAANTSRSQDKSSLNGKVLRINLDGTIPIDNPFSASPVWSFGHRNAQGLVFVNNILYSSEHGPGSDDEINIIEKGRNYGWPDVNGLCDRQNENRFCNEHNVKQPLKVWTPTLAVCGLDYYNHDRIPQLKNSLLLCTLKASSLIQLKLDGTRKTITDAGVLIKNKYGRLRDICISPDGKIYLCTSNGRNDKIIEIISIK